MTTISIPPPIKEFSKRLSHLDSKLAREIKNYLPYWWDDELANSSGAIQQLLISLAKFTNLDIKTVLNTHSSLNFKNATCCYKHANNKQQSDLTAATALVQSLANTVADITVNEYNPFQEIESIRNNFFEASKPWVDFKSLVRYCWKHGVPVLYFPELPVLKKMDAVVMDVNGRPVIALTKKHKHESELLFLLAHEMGHIFHGHLEQGQILIDTKVNESINERDEQENQANAFAIELLTGTKEPNCYLSKKWLKGDTLAKISKRKSKEIKVDPGHIALNWAHTNNRWGVGMSALNFLYSIPDWEDYIKQELCNNIDEDEANEDQLDYLYKLMNIEE